MKCRGPWKAGPRYLLRYLTAVCRPGGGNPLDYSSRRRSWIRGPDESSGHRQNARLAGGRVVQESRRIAWILGLSTMRWGASLEGGTVSGGNGVRTASGTVFAIQNGVSTRGWGNRSGPAKTCVSPEYVPSGQKVTNDDKNCCLVFSTAGYASAIVLPSA